MVPADQAAEEEEEYNNPRFSRVNRKIEIMH
jgi:hypothetical protein